MVYFLRLPKSLCLSWVVFTLMACGGGSGTTDKSTQTKNSTPIADAGGDQLVPTETQILLNGSNSFDEDNDPLSYRWSLFESPLNSQATLNNATSFNPTFVADLVGDYMVMLVVNDQVIDSVGDTVLISATEANIRPVANAGADQNVLTGNLVTLDGNNSIDANQDPLTFQWAMTAKPQASNATLTTNDEPTTSFTPDVDGTYLISLLVNDGNVESAVDEVTIISSRSNTAPMADAGVDQNILTGETATLDGRASSDADQDTLTYAWTSISSPSGSNSVIMNANSAIASLNTDIDGTYELQLSVSDGQAEHTDSIVITSTTNNVAPIANAGPDQQVSTGSQVTLNGSESRDDDNDALTFEWQLLSVPTNSSASLSSTNDTSPIFTADIDGTYIVQLRVSDGTVSSEIDSTSITSTTNTSSLIDQFDNTPTLLTIINNESSLPDITTNTGRYRANLTNNSNNITLHFNEDQGRLDAALVSFPFEFIARNIGIGRQDDSQVAPTNSGDPFLFAGVQVHALDLDDPNSSHVVVGHRGDTGFTIEGKNTVNGNSSVNDIGENEAPSGRADIRIVGNIDHTLTVYWQTPNLSPTTQQDIWNLYGANGNLPGSAPAYGDSVYVGLITYAFWSTAALPFVGTCDSIEIK